MNKYLKRLIELGAVVGGKLKSDDGFVVFERLSNEQLENVDENALGFATKAMGRAIFKVGENGKIINCKGVDSHLDNSESASMDLVSGKAVYIPKQNQSYIDSMYPINFVVFLGGRPDIRVRGASPLEDLEIEAYTNSRMQNLGVKLPKFNGIREFSQDFSKKYGLPIRVPGSFKEFSSDYEKENKTMKEYLKQNYGEDYQEIVENGTRPETLGEYFKRLQIDKNEDLIRVLNENNFTIEDFINYVDTDYSLGQRYGQAERILENPFRISDIEYYTKHENLEIVENIIAFSESIQQLDEPVENYFSKQMGINLGNMMNNGWRCENFVHRQDYTLAGEMCDDQYQYLPELLEKAKKYPTEKREAVKKDYKKGYFYQIYALGATVKVLQDEMRLRGKTEEEIGQIQTDFVDAFTKSVDLDKVSEFIDADAKEAIRILVQTPTNYEKLIASRTTKDGIKYHEETLLAQKGNNVFFDGLSAGIAQKFGIQRNFVAPRQNWAKKIENHATQVDNEDREDL